MAEKPDVKETACPGVAEKMLEVAKTVRDIIVSLEDPAVTRSANTLCRT